MTSRQSRREASRRSLRHPALYPCHVIRQRDHAVISRVALDLSAEGMQVLTGARVLTGEPVEVTFQAPETGAWLTLRGTVARVLHGRRPNEWGRRLGIEVEGLDDTQRARLLHACRLLDSRPLA